MDGRGRPQRSPATASDPDEPVLQAQRALGEAVLNLSRVLSAGIVADEALAEEIARIADGDARDDPSVEKALRAIARHHRIRALEGQARLAAIVEAYGQPLDPI